jgi:hypothetical protein
LQCEGNREEIEERNKEERFRLWRGWEGGEEGRESRGAVWSEKEVIDGAARVMARKKTANKARAVACLFEVLSDLFRTPSAFSGGKMDGEAGCVQRLIGDLLLVWTSQTSQIKIFCY